MQKISGNNSDAKEICQPIFRNLLNPVNPIVATFLPFLWPLPSPFVEQAVGDAHFIDWIQQQFKFGLQPADLYQELTGASL